MSETLFTPSKKMTIEQSFWSDTRQFAQLFPAHPAMQRPHGSAPTLVVSLLGAPLVYWNNEPLSIPRRQARALLYYLAATPQPVARGHTCWHFWPDEPEADAKQKLARLLYHLRCALPDEKLIQTNADYLYIDPAALVCDCRLLRNLWELQLHNQQARIPSLIITLYRGPFLAGFQVNHSPEFEQWAQMEAQQCEYQYLNLLKAYTVQLMEEEAWERAIICAELYLVIDQLDEEMHRTLMNLYSTVGNHGASGRQFDRCLDLLEHELGVSPSQSTWSAYRLLTN